MMSTPRGDRFHIAIFGRCNAGKSTLINALTGQEVALVSPVPGTTTDPVYKNMELLPYGPVVFIDTAGLDDTGMIGGLRTKRTREVIKKADLALIVIDPEVETSNLEEELVREITENGRSCIVILNLREGFDLDQEEQNKCSQKLGACCFGVNALTLNGIEALKEKIIQTIHMTAKERTILDGIVGPGDIVVLVTPIDASAPKGRLILPQVQTLRDILDKQATAIVCQENELKQTLTMLNKKPKVVITDSQAFKKVSADTPLEIPLTSFSILFARYKGELEAFLGGVDKLLKLKPGDKILIAEACTHHRQEVDIGKVKIPKWMEKQVGGPLKYEWYSGTGYPEELEEFQLVVHCGACMINRQEMMSRIQAALSKGIPIINYGILIACLHGILPRALQPIPEINEELLLGRNRLGLSG